MYNVKCPLCGFLSHFVSSDGFYAVYKCEKCNYVFNIPI